MWFFYRSARNLFLPGCLPGVSNALARSFSVLAYFACAHICFGRLFNFQGSDEGVVFCPFTCMQWEVPLGGCFQKKYLPLHLFPLGSGIFGGVFRKNFQPLHMNALGKAICVVCFENFPSLECTGRMRFVTLIQKNIYPFTYSHRERSFLGGGVFEKIFYPLTCLHWERSIFKVFKKLFYLHLLSACFHHKNTKKHPSFQMSANCHGSFCKILYLPLIILPYLCYTICV